MPRFVFHPAKGAIMRFLPNSVAVLSIMLSACSSLSTEALTGPEQILVLEVAPARVPCVGEMENMCLQVRAPGEESWRTFYDPIEGFRYEEGILYTLEVGRRKRLHPPADASAYVYRLLRILEQKVVT